MPSRCMANLTFVGHPGVDWGSAMPLGGFIPELNVSVSIASDAHGGMNMSLTQHYNRGLFGDLQCKLLSAAAVIKQPGFPGFAC